MGTEKEKCEQDLQIKPQVGEILNALSIYESNWQHRDNFTTKESYTLFYAGVVCNVVPFLLPGMGVCLPEFMLIMFPLAALAITVFLWIYMIACAARMYAANRTIENMMDLLPPELRRVKIADTPYGKSRLALAPMSLWVAATLSSVLFVFDEVVLGYFLYNIFLEFVGRNMLAIIIPAFVLVFVLWVFVIARTLYKYGKE